MRDLHRNFREPVRNPWMRTCFLPRLRVAMVRHAFESMPNLPASPSSGEQPPNLFSILLLLAVVECPSVNVSFSLPLCILARSLRL